MKEPHTLRTFSLEHRSSFRAAGAGLVPKAQHLALFKKIIYPGHSLKHSDYRNADILDVFKKRVHMQ